MDSSRHFTQDDGSTNGGFHIQIIIPLQQNKPHMYYLFGGVIVVFYAFFPQCF